MKFDALHTKRTLATTLQATKGTSAVKRRVDDSAADGEAKGLVTVHVPWCPWNINFERADARAPSLQFVTTTDNLTLATVLRDSKATANLSNRTQCVPRVYDIDVPSDPMLIEAASYFGSTSFIKPNTTLNTHAMREFGFHTQVIAFTYTSAARPSVYFSYRNGEQGPVRVLLTGDAQVLNYGPVAQVMAPPAAQALSLLDRRNTAQTTQAVTAATTTAASRKPDRAVASSPTLRPASTPAPFYTFTATILENKFFSGTTALNYDPTPTFVPTQTSTTSATPTGNISDLWAGIINPTALRHDATVTTFIPGPTNFVQANVLFRLQGANPNVALSFANTGAIIGFAALGVVGLFGYAALMRKVRATTPETLPAAARTEASAPTGDVAV